MDSRTLVAFVAMALVGSPAAAIEPVAAEIEDLAWMAGNWSLDGGAMVTEERWLGPAGGTMVGLNRTVEGDHTTGFEFLRLAERNGGVVLYASPAGRCPATEFVLIEVDAESAVFANPDHDFPQQISYRRLGQRLHAEIEGVENGEHRRAGWVFERVP